MTDIKFEGVSFNAKYWKKYSEKDFIAINMQEGKFPKYSEANRRIMLKAVYKMIKGNDVAPIK